MSYKPRIGKKEKKKRIFMLAAIRGGHFGNAVLRYGINKMYRAQ